MIFDAAIVDISHSSFLHFLLKRSSVFDTWAPALESLLFWESRGPEGAGTRFQRYLPESCHPPQSWFWSAAQGSQLPHQAAFWPLNHIFWGVMKISRCKFCPLLGFVSHLLDPLPAHLMFLRLTAPSSLPHFHNKVGWEEQQRKFPTFLPGISGCTRAHHTEACVHIFHVFPQIGFGQRGCPRPHPMPTGRPTPMFDFFLTTPGEPVGAPTPTGFLTGFLSCWTRRQRRPSAGTHVTHGRHLALLGSLTTLDALYQLLETLIWSRGLQFLLMPVANFSMAVSVNCVRRLSLGVPERTPASSRRPEFPGCGFHHHHHHHSNHDMDVHVGFYSHRHSEFTDHLSLLITQVK